MSLLWNFHSGFEVVHGISFTMDGCGIDVPIEFVWILLQNKCIQSLFITSTSLTSQYFYRLECRAVLKIIVSTLPLIGHFFIFS